MPVDWNEVRNGIALEGFDYYFQHAMVPEELPEPLQDLARAYRELTLEIERVLAAHHIDVEEL